MKFTRRVCPWKVITTSFLPYATFINNVRIHLLLPWDKSSYLHIWCFLVSGVWYESFNMSLVQWRGTPPARLVYFPPAWFQVTPESLSRSFDLTVGLTCFCECLHTALSILVVMWPKGGWSIEGVIRHFWIIHTVPCSIMERVDLIFLFVLSAGFGVWCGW